MVGASCASGVCVFVCVSIRRVYPTLCFMNHAKKHANVFIKNQKCLCMNIKRDYVYTPYKCCIPTLARSNSKTLKIRLIGLLRLLGCTGCAVYVCVYVCVYACVYVCTRVLWG